MRRLARSFLEHRRATAYSSHTLKRDELALRRFTGWLASEKPTLHSLMEIDARALDDYAVWLALYETEDGGRLKPASRFTLLSALLGFFRWLEAEGKILKDPARRLKLPRVPKPFPRGVLTCKEMTRLLAVPDLTTTLGRRDRAILELLYSSGIRNSELRSLKLTALNLSEGLVTVHEGKGKKSRVVPIGKTAGRHLVRYLEESRPRLRRSRFEEHVFLSRTGRALASVDLIVLIRKAGEKAGLGKPVRPHGLRHTCATHLLKGGADIRYIQELLGHASLSSTQVYTHVAAADLKRVHERCHPRERKP